MKPRMVGLFSGAGGLDLGGVMAGADLVLAVDHESDAIDTHKRNLGSTAIRADVRRPGLSLSPEFGCDLLVAGPPCQSFSTAGKMRENDERSTLLFEPARVSRLLKPKSVVVENVPQVRRGHSADLWKSLHAKLRRQGYRTTDFEFCASQAGLAQRRKRVFLVAMKDQDPSQLRFDFSSPKTLEDALDGVDLVPDHKPTFLDGASASGRIAKHIGEGQKLSNVRAGSLNVHTWDIPEVFGATTENERQVLRALLTLRRRDRRRAVGDGDPVAARSLAKYLGRPVYSDLVQLTKNDFVRKTEGRYELRSTFNGKYRRLARDRPASTVHTTFVQARYFLHPHEHRGFTVREAARLQGFPDHFEFSGSVRSRARQVGNAVAPPLAELVLKPIVQTIAGATN